MADASIRQLATQCRELRYEALPDAVKSDALLLVVDTLGCMVAGWDSPPARIARQLAYRVQSDRPARVMGSGTPSSVELAGFANTVGARYLDYNDTYQGVGTGHPSDVIPGLLALAEAEHVDGRTFLTSVVAAYEAFGAIVKEVPIRDKGWDQGVMIGLGEAAGASVLLGLDQEQTENALGLVVTMCAPTRATRSGRLFMWKGAATAAASRLGIFAADLAKAGMTGPDEPIEGRHGLWDQVTGKFPVHTFGDPDPWIVSTTSFKFLPFESNAHGAIDLAKQLLRQATVDELDKIAVTTYWNGWHDIGSEPAKWNPDTRETAEHSLPFILAAYLVDGGITKDSFDDAHIADPRIREVMARITCDEDPELTALWPDEVHTRIAATLTDGRVLTLDVAHPTGHFLNRGTPEDVDDKFRLNAAEVLGAERAEAVLAHLKGLPDVADVADTVSQFVGVDID
ncbi:MAG TPA: MmgE/PrpD family protein [Cellulomonas sp.]